MRPGTWLAIGLVTACAEGPGGTCEPGGTPPSSQTTPTVDTRSPTTTEDTGSLQQLPAGDVLPWKGTLTVEPLVRGEPVRIVGWGVGYGTEDIRFFRGRLLQERPGEPVAERSCPVLAGGCLEMADAQLIGSVDLVGGASDATLSWVVPDDEPLGEYIVFQAVNAYGATQLVVRRVVEAWPPPPQYDEVGWDDPFDHVDLSGSDEPPALVAPGVWMDLFMRDSDALTFEVDAGELLIVGLDPLLWVNGDDEFQFLVPNGTAKETRTKIGPRFEWEWVPDAAGVATLELRTEYGEYWAAYSLTVLTY